MKRAIRILSESFMLFYTFIVSSYRHLTHQTKALYPFNHLTYLSLLLLRMQ
jgi:hypothetical protein